MRKLCNALQHFGLWGCLVKAWEKFVVDAYRFRSGLHRQVPAMGKTYHAAGELMPEQAPERKTICYLVHYFFPDKSGGTERFVLNLARQQQQLGMRVRVITLGKRDPERYAHETSGILWDEFGHEGIEVTQFRYRRAPLGVYYDRIDPDDASMQAFAQMVIERYRPDAVHFAYPQPFAAFAAVCRAQGIPCVITLTDFNMLCHYSSMVRRDGHFCSGSDCGRRCADNCPTAGVRDAGQRYAYASQMLQDAQAITVPSQFVAHIISQEFPKVKIHVIPHGISEQFAIRSVRSRTRRFVYAGTLTSLKGVHVLIAAFMRLKNEDCTLDVYGSGDQAYEKKLRLAACKDSRIRFLGNVKVERMPAVFQEVDCVVVPSIWYETYNFVLREALQCGCLGIASDIGAMPEAIMEGRNGFLFEAGSVDALYQALEQACAFRWENYVPSVFSSLHEESGVYSAIYQSIKGGKALASNQCIDSGV